MHTIIEYLGWRSPNGDMFQTLNIGEHHLTVGEVWAVTTPKAKLQKMVDNDCVEPRFVVHGSLDNLPEGNHVVVQVDGKWRLKQGNEVAEEVAEEVEDTTPVDPNDEDLTGAVDLEIPVQTQDNSGESEKTE